MLDRYEQEAESFITELSREYYLSGAGLKDTLEVTKIYKEYAWLFRKDIVLEILSSIRSKRRRYLAEFAALSYLQALTKKLNEAITNFSLKANMEWDGQRVSYRYVQVLLANEQNMSRRHDLEQRVSDITAKCNRQRQERLVRLHKGTRALGFENYIVMCNDLRRLKLAELTKMMTDFLAVTKEPFARLQSSFLKSINVPENKATNADILYLIRSPQYDKLFPKEKLIFALRATLAGMGINMEKQYNLYLDVEPRPLKTPRPFCSPIKVPDEVKLVIMPKGGPDDYRSVMHEMGHAQHALNTDRNIPFAFRRLGDNSVTEGYAFLFDNLTHNPHWLKSILGVSDRGYIQLALFYKLRMLRRYGAKLLYEQRLHKSNGGPTLAEAYVDLLGRHIRVRPKKGNYLADIDDAFYCAQYLRAWIFEVQLRRFLERKFGDDWFMRRKAGDFLRELWRYGQQFTVEELLQQMGYKGLDIRPLTEEVMLLNEF